MKLAYCVGEVCIMYLNLRLVELICRTGGDTLPLRRSFTANLPAQTRVSFQGFQLRLSSAFQLPTNHWYLKFYGTANESPPK
jgi:hypothetical protein